MTTDERLTALEQQMAQVLTDIDDIKFALQTGGVASVANADLSTYVEQQLSVLRAEDDRLAGLINNHTITLATKLEGTLNGGTLKISNYTTEELQ